MSADNWMHCPRCEQAHVENRQKEIQKAKNLYGVIGPDEYNAAMQIAEAIPESPEDETFRENYEIGMESEGTFTIGYSGHCTECDYSHDFDHTEEVPR